MGNVQITDKSSENQAGMFREQSVLIDDHLLPNAAELERLKQVDSSIIPWIMERTEKEQSARLQWNKTQEDILKYNLKGTHRFNYTALIFAFLLFVLVILSAVFCIIKGKNIEGTILGGTAIITGIIFFLRTSITRNS